MNKLQAILLFYDVWNNEGRLKDFLELEKMVPSFVYIRAYVSINITRSPSHNKFSTKNLFVL